MIFTWDWSNTCIVFEWWHVTTLLGFCISNISIILLGAGYEALKFHMARITATRRELFDNGASHSRRNAILEAAEYALQVGYSFMLMLVFMTYNGWYMLSVVIGAGLGYYFWGNRIPPNALLRPLSCH